MEPVAPGRRGILLAAIVLIGAGILVYANTFAVPFIYDDYGTIVNNPAIHGLLTTKRESAPSGEANRSSRPVADFTFAINYALGGLDVRGYHAVNLLIHLLAALTLFGIVRRTLAGAALRERFGAHATPLAFIAALLWLVHPLQTESVTYIIHRYESLLGLFFLLTVYAAIRGMESSGWGWLAASVVFCALGMATKERMVVAPLMVLLYDRAFVSGTFKEVLRKRPAFYIGLAATWVVLAVAILRAASVAGGFGFGMTTLDYVRIQIPAVVHYLQQAFWPHPLVLHCGFDFENGRPIFPGAVEVMTSLVILTALLAVTVFAVFRRPRWGVPAVWFFLLLAPTSSIIPNWEAVEEHHTYLPIAGVIVLAVVSFYLAWRTPLGRRVGIALAVLCATALGAATFARNHDYRDAVSIWEDTAGKRPLSPRACNNLGFSLGKLERLDEAIPLLKKAIELKPDYAAAYDNLGTAIMHQGRTREALPYFKKALELDPTVALVYNNLGNAFIQLGRAEEAVPLLRRAVQIDPDYATAWCNLGTALGQSGRADEALPLLRKSVQIDPANASAQCNLGFALLQRGRAREAIPYFEEAIRLDPKFLTAHSNLFEAYAAAGRFGDAAKAARKALDVAVAAGQGAVAEQIRERLKSYEAGRPWREPSKP